MARFSIGREEESEGPSSRRPKKRRNTHNLHQYNHELHHQQLVEQEQVESENQEEDEDNEGIESEQQEDDDEDEVEELEEIDDQRNITAVTRHTSNGGCAGNDRDTVGSNSTIDGYVSVILTDPDVLDCPICLEHLTTPVFQCENGHIACSSCCLKVRNKCPSCSLPIGYNRCRAIEKVLDSVKISCRNMEYGCKEAVKYSKKHDHEQMCIHAPCSCPLPGCLFVGSSKQLYQHFSSKHPNSATRFCYNGYFSVSLERNQKYLILQEQDEGIIFILNNGVQCLGNVVNVNCLGPRSSKIAFSYDLVARNGGSSVRLQSFTENMPTWFEHLPRKQVLLVPTDYIGSCGQLVLRICIWRRDSGVCYSK